MTASRGPSRLFGLAPSDADSRSRLAVERYLLADGILGTTTGVLACLLTIPWVVDDVSPWLAVVVPPILAIIAAGVLLVMPLRRLRPLLHRRVPRVARWFAPLGHGVARRSIGLRALGWSTGLAISLVIPTSWAMAQFVLSVAGLLLGLTALAQYPWGTRDRPFG